MAWATLNELSRVLASRARKKVTMPYNRPTTLLLFLFGHFTLMNLFTFNYNLPFFN